VNAEITTKKEGSKWHGYIDGRPDFDETALSEEATRGKMEQLRDRIGPGGATMKLFGGRTCELIDGHRVPGKTSNIEVETSRGVIDRSECRHAQSEAMRGSAGA